MKKIVALLSFISYGFLWTAEGFEFNEQATDDLWGAVKGKNIEQVILAIGQGADIDDTEFLKDGDSVLSRAIQEGAFDIAELLISQGANVNAVDDFGISVLSVAIDYNAHSIIKKLLERGATIPKKLNFDQIVMLNDIIERINGERKELLALYCKNHCISRASVQDTVMLLQQIPLIS